MKSYLSIMCLALLLASCSSDIQTEEAELQAPTIDESILTKELANDLLSPLYPQEVHCQSSFYTLYQTTQPIDYQEKKRMFAEGKMLRNLDLAEEVVDYQHGFKMYYLNSNGYDETVMQIYRYDLYDSVFHWIKEYTYKDRQWDEGAYRNKGTGKSTRIYIIDMNCGAWTFSGVKSVFQETDSKQAEVLFEVLYEASLVSDLATHDMEGNRWSEMENNTIVTMKANLKYYTGDGWKIEGEVQENKEKPDLFEDYDGKDLFGR